VEVLLYHLPPAGYEFGSSLPPNEAGAALRWRELSAVLAHRSRTGLLLILNGADHHARQEDLDRARLSLGRAAAPVPVAAASLATFADGMRTRTAAGSLPSVEGELRASPDYVWALQGTFGARAAQKRDNAALERLLVRHVEPTAAMLSWRGGASYAFALRGIWRLVLASHPHDTLCGCSVDDVALAMTDRMRRAERAAQELHRRVVGALVEEGEGRERTLVVANPAPRVRGGIVEAEVDIALAPVPVGPDSDQAGPETRQAPPFTIGTSLPMQRLDRGRTFVRDEGPRQYPRNALAERQRVLAWVPELPPYGMRTLRINEGVQARRAMPRPVCIVEGGQCRSCQCGWMRDAALRVESAGRTTRSHGVRERRRTRRSVYSVVDPGTRRLVGSSGRA
jgi:hypothetical protein